ncbi:MAG: YqhA family protein [Aliihoeflea sp.]|uniref:YqhA family protein n=1 Tax=Aliihoeflea sp. TaxID=2608088 RepID=UPI004037F035
MPALERAIEALIFASRWILAPFFLGLLVAMVVLLFKFMKELLDLVLNIWTTSRAMRHASSTRSRRSSDRSMPARPTTRSSREPGSSGFTRSSRRR